jgi:hypothetical protein
MYPEPTISVFPNGFLLQKISSLVCAYSYAPGIYIKFGLPPTAIKIYCAVLIVIYPF